MKETTTERHPRGFATISTPDGRDRIWLPRPTASGQIYATCSFALSGRMPLVDSIDTLGYVRVERATTYDNDYSSLHLACLTNPQDCLEQLMEDLPKVMEEWL